MHPSYRKGGTPLKITIFGAGAIGSLLGAHLCRHHDVTLIGRPPHITAIQDKGLTLTGKTACTVRIRALTTLPTETPDLIILTVKAYDTKAAAQQIKKILTPSTTVLTLQNGLGNIEALEKAIPRAQLLAGVLTHGALIAEPGTVMHTGRGILVIGELDGTRTRRLQDIAAVFTASGLPATITRDITTDIWIKTIVNSSINPLTAFFACPNGYLHANPILRRVVDQICAESTAIAKAAGIKVTKETMIAATAGVIRATSQNSSSMLQSLQRGKPTEIEALNGALTRMGDRCHADASLNRLLTQLIHWKEHQQT